MDTEREMGLLELPDLVSWQLLSYLTFSDLCRLRLTSRMAGEWATEAFRSKMRIRIEVQEGTARSFESALLTGEKMGLIEIDELYIENDTAEIYKTEQARDFLEVFGAGVKKLRLKNYFLDSPAQMRFLVALPNVQSLRIDLIDASGHRCRYTTAFTPCKELELPSFFQHLTELTLGTIRIDSVLETDFWYPMIAGAPRLNYLRYPRVECKLFVPGVDNEKKFELFKHLIQTHAGLRVGGLGCKATTPLMAIDFKNMDNAADILQEECQFRIFRGVSATLPVEALESFNRITSVVGFHPVLSILPVIALQEISIPRLSAVEWEDPIDDWDSLQSIRLNFDHDFVMGDLYRIHRGVPPDTNIPNMCEFLFLSEMREYTVTKLKISFDSSLLNLHIPLFILDARAITEGLCGLTHLTLVRWNPTNTAFVRLWNGLPQLEELWIEDCPSLGNVGFVGRNLEAPAFLNLKKLAKLTLILDKMPKLTDRCFKDVFRHLRLKEFHLRSVNPLPNITKVGISWLLQGEFTKTVERFPFDSWSSTTISAQEMVQLKAQFGSLIS